MRYTIQMTLAEGNYNKLQKVTRKRSAGADQEPSPEDKNFRIYQLVINILPVAAEDY